MSEQEHRARLQVLATIRRRFIGTIGSAAYNRIVMSPIGMIHYMATDTGLSAATLARISLQTLAAFPSGSRKVTAMLGAYEVLTSGHHEPQEMQ